MFAAAFSDCGGPWKEEYENNATCALAIKFGSLGNRQNRKKPNYSLQLYNTR